MNSQTNISANDSGEMRQAIGYVIGGGLKANLFVRLTVPAQSVQEGGFVVLESGDWLFYGLVVDLQLASLDQHYAEEIAVKRLSPKIAELLKQQTLYTNLEVLPALMLERGPEPGMPGYEEWRKAHPEDPRPMPIKTIPFHQADARLATAGDVAEIFGSPDEEGNFIIGNTREQDHPVCINLDKFVQRSSGIFGATGTGKSFLTRIILAGLIQHNAASVLVLDMHNEYGFDDTSSDTGQAVIGLKSKFGSQIQVVGLGRGSSVRGHTPDFHLEFSYSDIQPQDIELLSKELNLKETTPTTIDALIQSFGPRDWLRKFKDMKNEKMLIDPNGNKVPSPDSVEYWANKNGVNVVAAEGLRGKLNRLFNCSYIIDDPQDSINTLKMITNSLETGKHVFLSFGDNTADLDYLLVSNILTRKIREIWEYKTNQFRGHKEKEPRPLVIVVEEAHKLLNREMASQTTFATIAREMRKYYVTLLVIDQRPSQIYDEVMSQLGTRITGHLGDESDIAAVLSGVAGRDTLRNMLSHLQEKEEILLLGWGVPMPILLRSRRYGLEFYRDMLGKKDERSMEQNLHELGYQ